MAAYRRYTFARNDLLFTMSDNTRMQTARERDALHARICFHGRAAGESELIDRWWSQTESNRRPPACKAGALPTELWPRIAAPAKREVVGLGRFELPTSRLSGVRSNHLSYRPMGADRSKLNREGGANRIMHTPQRRSMRHVLLRKEVIQPQVPLRLPCYDFTPVADLTVAGCLLAVSAPASGKTNSHGVTGGVYKARERIHRGVLIRDY